MVDRTFEGLDKRMKHYFSKLEMCQLTKWSESTAICGEKESRINKGVYVFYKDCEALYVGRSDGLLGRVRTHGNKGSRKAEAAFAAAIARKKAMKTFKEKNPEIYKCCKSDKERLNTLNKELRNREGDLRKAFDADFTTAKESIRNMKVRVVNIEHSIDQAIFEIYAHVRLGTPYNNFDNH